MNIRRLRFGYRAMQVALVAAVLALAAKWYDQHLDGQSDASVLAGRKEMLSSCNDLFKRATEQRDLSKKSFEVAEARLKADEAREASAKEQQ